MLKVFILAENLASLPQRRERLKILENANNVRLAHWEQSDIDVGLKSTLAAKSAETANRFWIEVNQELLPGAVLVHKAAIDRSQLYPPEGHIQ